MKQNKKTVVLGASTNPSRYSYLAMHRLLQEGFEPVPVGIKNGKVAGIEILHGKPAIKNVDTVTLYLNPGRQVEYYDYILSLKPVRIIFNPGTENEELKALAVRNNIEPVEACTLVMLATGQF